MVETQYVEYWLEEIGQIPEERDTTEELLALLPVLDENQELNSAQLSSRIESQLRLPEGHQKCITNDECDVCSTHLSQLKSEAVTMVQNLEDSQLMSIPRERYQASRSNGVSRPAKLPDDMTVNGHVQGNHGNITIDSVNPPDSSAGSFFSRAAQKLTPKKKTKKSSKNEPVSLPMAGSSATTAVEKVRVFPTNFTDLLARCPPPPPPSLVKYLSKRGDGGGKVKVMVRVCPNFPGEKGSFLRVDHKKKQVTLYDPSTVGHVNPLHKKVGVAAPKMFGFDAIFESDSSQIEVCSTAIVDVLQAVVNGSDGCIFCYGHAGLGKTFTMVGRDETQHTAGIIPSSISWLFNLMNEQKQKSGARFSVRVSAIEVVGSSENLRDLLADQASVDSSASSDVTSPSLYLLEDPVAGVQLQNQSELRAASSEKAAYYLDAALAARTRPSPTADGELDVETINSHMFFTIHVYQYRVDKHSKSGSGVQGGRSRLHLIDLASCDRLPKKDKTSPSLSLSGLGNVILSLVGSAKHIPHKDSKITRLLRDSLGNMACRTCMVCHISPSLPFFNESLATVQFAAKLHRLRRKRGKYSGTSSSGGDSCDESRIRKPRLRTNALSYVQEVRPSGSGGHSDYASSTGEESCDTVVYVGKDGKELSDRELTDNEGPAHFFKGKSKDGKRKSNDHNEDDDDISNLKEKLKAMPTLKHSKSSKRILSEGSSKKRKIDERKKKEKEKKSKSNSITVDGVDKDIQKLENEKNMCDATPVAQDDTGEVLSPCDKRNDTADPSVNQQAAVPYEDKTREMMAQLDNNLGDMDFGALDAFEAYGVANELSVEPSNLKEIHSPRQKPKQCKKNDSLELEYDLLHEFDLSNTSNKSEEVARWIGGLDIPVNKGRKSPEEIAAELSEVEESETASVSVVEINSEDDLDFDDFVVDLEARISEDEEDTLACEGVISRNSSLSDILDHIDDEEEPSECEPVNSRPLETPMSLFYRLVPDSQSSTTSKPSQQSKHEDVEKETFLRSVSERSLPTGDVQDRIDPREEDFPDDVSCTYSTYSVISCEVEEDTSINKRNSFKRLSRESVRSLLDNYVLEQLAMAHARRVPSTQSLPAQFADQSPSRDRCGLNDGMLPPLLPRQPVATGRAVITTPSPRLSTSSSREGSPGQSHNNVHSNCDTWSARTEPIHNLPALRKIAERQLSVKNRDYLILNRSDGASVRFLGSEDGHSDGNLEKCSGSSGSSYIVTEIEDEPAWVETLEERELRQSQLENERQRERRKMKKKRGQESTEMSDMDSEQNTTEQNADSIDLEPTCILELNYEGSVKHNGYLVRVSPEPRVRRTAKTSKRPVIEFLAIPANTPYASKITNIKRDKRNKPARIRYKWYEEFMDLIRKESTRICAPASSRVSTEVSETSSTSGVVSGRSGSQRSQMSIVSEDTGIGLSELPSPVPPKEFASKDAVRGYSSGHCSDGSASDSSAIKARKKRLNWRSSSNKSESGYESGMKTSDSEKGFPFRKRKGFQNLCQSTVEESPPEPIEIKVYEVDDIERMQNRKGKEMQSSLESNDDTWEDPETQQESKQQNSVQYKPQEKVLGKQEFLQVLNEENIKLEEQIKKCKKHLLLETSFNSLSRETTVV